MPFLKPIQQCQSTEGKFFISLLMVKNRYLCKEHSMNSHDFVNRTTRCVSTAIAVVACLSVTHQCCIEMDKDIVTLFSQPLWFLTPHMVGKF